MGDFRHKHSLGQNFLKDKNVLLKIIDSVDVQKDDLIIEIGPGQGALTKYLKLYNANLICYELDNRVKKYLEKFEDEKTKVVFKDFLRADVLNDIKTFDYKNIYVIANLPYYITSPIIEKIIELKLNVTSMVLMVQNEVADRFSARVGTKDYGAMTLYLQYYFEVQKLFFVSKKAFDPVPNVDSAVIKFNKRQISYNVKDEKILFRLINDSFKMKRKNLRNNLKNYDSNLILNIFEKYNLTLQDRAENVPLECFVEIANEISKE